MDGLHVFYLYVCFFLFNFDAEAPSFTIVILTMKKMELMKNAAEYIAPQVNVIEVEVEKGFAVSGENDPWEKED